ncbi:hypothetical protein NPIL_485701 [Nephila pilipes]|uniref:Uncharacterized protein n=1 Tax=Nephila pilipes TaxID=299642 RepID=A0A8X6PJI1_NEPPI|nr:hypothetical protein NPIL_485701 [Nephila pilipes]
MDSKVYSKLLQKKQKHSETCRSEFGKAELIVFKIVHKESFDGEDDKKLKYLSVCKNEDGLLKIKTKIIYRKDIENLGNPSFSHLNMK